MTRRRNDGPPLPAALAIEQQEACFVVGTATHDASCCTVILRLRATRGDRPFVTVDPQTTVLREYINCSDNIYAAVA